MKSITKDRFIKTLQEKKISLFSYSDLFRLFNLESEATAKSLLYRLKKAKIIAPLTKGKFQFLLARQLADDFAIANFIYPPSYVSLESALSYYGLIDQFPYQVTSITVNKARLVKINEKEYAFARIRPVFFKDYIRREEFIIAGELKAAFDYLYLVYKGARAESGFSLIRGINKVDFRQYVLKLATGKDDKFISFCKSRELI